MADFHRLKEALADRYALERELGAGGMATVYLAHDQRHNRKVAIKVMNFDSVAMNPTDGAAAFDVSENGTLAYLPVSSYVKETKLVLVDRRGNESRALPVSDRYDHPRLSPEGGRIAVDVRSANSLGDIWVFHVGRSGGLRLTAEGGRDFGAEWTPDGRELIYSSEHPFFDLYRRAADASRPAEPLLTGGFDRYPRLGVRGRPIVCLFARRAWWRALDRAAARPARAGALFRQRIQPRASHAVARRPLDGLRFR